MSVRRRFNRKNVGQKVRDTISTLLPFYQNFYLSCGSWVGGKVNSEAHKKDFLSDWVAQARLERAGFLRAFAAGGEATPTQQGFPCRAV